MANGEQQNNKKAIRGPLRYQIDPSTTQVEAGKQFSVFIRITNPYDVPATVKTVATRLPAKFLDIQALEREKELKSYSKRIQQLTKDLLANQIPELKQTEEEKKAALHDMTREIIRSIPFFGGYLAGGYAAVRFAKASAVTVSAVESTQLLEPAEIDAIVKEVKDSSRPLADFYHQAVTYLQKKMADASEQHQPEVVLQPGNSTVQTFTLKTEQSVFFAPASYNLTLEIEYDIDGNVNHDAVDYKLQIRAPLHALIYGSMIGAAAGYLLRTVFDTKELGHLLDKSAQGGTLVWSVGLLGNVLLGSIIVVAFARKKDAQPILSIEDFWGGVFAGFLAGYSGKSILDQFVQGTGSAGGTTGTNVPRLVQ